MDLQHAYSEYIAKYIHAVDECQVENGGCEQICEDTTLGFNCQCRSGYTLNSDRRNCTGNDVFSDLTL